MRVKTKVRFCSAAPSDSAPRERRPPRFGIRCAATNALLPPCPIAQFGLGADDRG